MLDVKEAGKAVRQTLKETFKGCTFSVNTTRSKRNDSIEISWVDGPTVEQVKTLLEPYKVQNRYISFSRLYSTHYVETAIGKFKQLHPEFMDANIGIGGSLYNSNKYPDWQKYTSVNPILDDDIIDLAEIVLQEIIENGFFLGDSVFALDTLNLELGKILREKIDNKKSTDTGYQILIIKELTIKRCKDLTKEQLLDLVININNELFLEKEHGCYTAKDHMEVFENFFPVNS